MEEHLKSLGADVVISEKTSGSHNMASILEVQCHEVGTNFNIIATCIQNALLLIPGVW